MQELNVLGLLFNLNTEEKMELRQSTIWVPMIDRSFKVTGTLPQETEDIEKQVSHHIAASQ